MKKTTLNILLVLSLILMITSVIVGIVAEEPFFILPSIIAVVMFVNCIHELFIGQDNY